MTGVFLFLFNQMFHGIGVLLYEDIHAAGIHPLRVNLIFAVYKHRRYTLKLEISGRFFLLRNQ